MSNNKGHFLALIGQQRGEPGRGTVYDADLHCQVVRMLGQQGKFPETWAAKIGVTMGTMRRWVQTHEEFAEAIIIARHLLQSYWSEELAKNRNNPNAKPGIYSMIMRRFPELYGTSPVDLFNFLETPIEDNSEGARDVTPITPEGVRMASDDEIKRRLEILRKRQQAEKENG